MVFFCQLPKGPTVKVMPYDKGTLFVGNIGEGFKQNSV